MPRSTLAKYFIALDFFFVREEEARLLLLINKLHIKDLNAHRIISSNCNFPTHSKKIKNVILELAYK
jgi:hypothetical protein